MLALLHVLTSSLLRGPQMRKRHHAPMKNEIMNGNQGDHVTFFVNMASKQAKIEFLSHSSSIYSTPRCRCHAQTYTAEPRWHTSYTGGLVWAVRLWISGRGPTMCSKREACMLICKMHNTFNATVRWKTSQVWVSSAATQERHSIFSQFTKKIILIYICILN